MAAGSSVAAGGRWRSASLLQSSDAQRMRLNSAAHDMQRAICDGKHPKCCVTCVEKERHVQHRNIHATRNNTSVEQRTGATVVQQAFQRCQPAAVQQCIGATGNMQRPFHIVHTLCNGSPRRPLQYTAASNRCNLVSNMLWCMLSRCPLHIACCMLVVAWCRLQNAAWDKGYDRTVRACTCACVRPRVCERVWHWREAGGEDATGE